MHEKRSHIFGGFSGETWPALSLPEAEVLGAVMAFSVRAGGHSPQPFDSLNLSGSEGDTAANVRRNLAVFSEAVGIDPERIVFAHQIHEDRIQLVTSPRSDPQEADAMIAAEPGVFVAVKTADCLHILLLDPERQVIAVVHAGWKGTVLRITRKVLRRLTLEFGTDPADLLVALGPVIGPCCYTVDETVIVPFQQAFPCPERFLKSSGSAATLGRGPGYYRMDIPGANRFELMAQGVREINIHDVGLCTACNPELFFSHRRDRGLTGRHIAVVGFRG